MQHVTFALAAITLAAFLVWLAATPQQAAAQGESATPSRAPSMLADLDSYLDQRAREFNEITPERLQELGAFAAAIKAKHEAGEPIRLNFVCTHNSRRSHMGQLFMQAASLHQGIRNVECFSGGTEATAFNPRAVAALRRAGFRILRTTTTDNPIYHTTYADDMPALTNFSKKYDTAPNPTSGFIAVMVCDSADEACPLVQGADERYAITYKDPKAFDGTDREADAYDERAAQIARELLWVASRVVQGTPAISAE